MTEKEVLGFKPTTRLEQVGDEHPKCIKESQASPLTMQRFYLIMLIQVGWNFRKGQGFGGLGLARQPLRLYLAPLTTPADSPAR